MERKDQQVSEDWDTGEWVDVGPDGRWRPSMSDRARSLVILAAALGVLLVLAAVLSVGDADDEEEVVATTTSSTTVPDTASTALPDPTSVGGDPPPEECAFDDRDGAPLRDRSETGVLVRNGTPRGGHAGEVTERLRSLGYTPLEPGNAPVQETTTIVYRPGSCAEAIQLMADLAVEGAQFEALPPENDAVLGLAHVLVTLGRDSL